MIKVGKQRFVEQFVTHPPVEAFDERIFGGLARAGIVPLDAGLPAPFENRVRGQLGAIVTDNHAGLAANGNQIGEFAHDALTRDRRIGHTLTGQIEQVERLTGIAVERAYVDRGYRGHKHSGNAEVYIAHSRGITSPTIKRELKRRNAVEPIIGHTKSDGLLERNHLAGATGGAINALLVAAGHNLRLLVAWLVTLLRALITAWLLALQPAAIAP